MRRLNRIIPLLILAAATPGRAQSPLLDLGTKGNVWLQVQHPTRYSDYYRGSAFLVDAGAAIRTGKNERLLLEVPVIYADVAGGNTVIGNPWIGLRERQGGGYFDLGVRVPLHKDNVGPAADAVVADFDHAEAFFPRVLSVNALYSMTTERGDSDGIVGRFRAGATAWVPIGAGGGELLADYGGTLVWRYGSVDAAAGVTGRMFLNNVASATLAQRTVNHAVFGLTLHRARVRPTVFVRLPLGDNARALYDQVIGFGVAADWRN